MTSPVPHTSQAIATALNRLIAVVAQLRSPEGGCPWDLEQTPQTLIPYVLEEAYEVVHALQSQEQEAIAEELGDLLLQVVLQAQIAAEYGHFHLGDVAQNITEKLIRRHPHVFGDQAVSGVEEVRQNWEAIKRQEKGQDPGQAQPLSEQLTRYAQTLPPLMASLKMSKKVAQVGLEWNSAEEVWGKFEEELAEFREALGEGDRQHQEAELGDLLFTVVQLGRWYGLDPSAALQGTNRRMVDRIRTMERLSPQSLGEYDLGELDRLWQQAKQLLHQKESGSPQDL